MYTVVCVLMAVVLSTPVKAQGSEEILTNTVWDFQSTKHQYDLWRLTADHTRSMHDWGVEGIPRDEVEVLYKYTANGFPYTEKITTIDWKVYFHVLADISEWSSMYFGGPLKIKDREVQRSKSLLEKRWDYTSPEDREALTQMILQQAESGEKLIMKKSGQKEPEGYSAGEEWYQFSDYSLVMKDTLKRMIPEKYQDGKTIFQMNDNGWKLFFIITESMSYWSKEFYGTPFLEEEILLK